MKNLLTLESIANVTQWAVARNLIEGATPQAQFLKLVEEISEVVKAETDDQFIDGIGDSLVVLTIMSAQLGFKFEDLDLENINIAERPDNVLVVLGSLAEGVAKQKPEQAKESIIDLVLINIGAIAQTPFTLQQCYDAAYAEIKDRTGKMVDGVFIRDL